jgi:hypothetical protein
VEGSKVTVCACSAPPMTYRKTASTLNRLGLGELGTACGGAQSDSACGNNGFGERCCALRPIVRRTTRASLPAGKLICEDIHGSLLPEPAVDDRPQARIALESQAVVLILEKVDRGEHALCNSAALVVENSLWPKIQERLEIEALLDHADIWVPHDKLMEERAVVLPRDAYPGQGRTGAVAQGMEWGCIEKQWRGAVSRTAIAEAVRLANKAFFDQLPDPAAEPACR